MLRDMINESRAASGMNAIPTGVGAGKGDIIRMSVRPHWMDMEEIGRTESCVIFRSGIASKIYVPIDVVEKYRTSQEIDK